MQPRDTNTDTSADDEVTALPGPSMKSFNFGRIADPAPPDHSAAAHYDSGRSSSSFYNPTPLDHSTAAHHYSGPFYNPAPLHCKYLQREWTCPVRGPAPADERVRRKQLTKETQELERRSVDRGVAVAACRQQSENESAIATAPFNQMLTRTLTPWPRHRASLIGTG